MGEKAKNLLLSAGIISIIIAVIAAFLKLIKMMKGLIIWGIVITCLVLVISYLIRKAKEKRDESFPSGD